ncbi:MAG: hypothetical protein QM817_09105 [Archangium sp.]
MIRVRVTLALLLVVVSGCVKRLPDGTVLRSLPKCEKQGRSVRAKPLDEAVQPCMRLLTLEPVDSSRSLIGLSTDEKGKIARVCLAGSTHDSDSRFLNCVADQLEAAAPILPPNQECLVWTLNVGY